MEIIKLLLIMLLALIYAKGETTPPPNIVVIMADDMGIDDVSFHGAKQYVTPNIDAIAYHGMILHNFYTPPMCTPSRAAFMTGKYPFHTGTQHYVISNETPWGLPTNLTTIAEIFKNAGYSTHLIGKWHLGLAYKEMWPTNRGFDSHYGYLGAYVDYYHRRAQMPVQNTSMGYDFRRNNELECAEEGTYLTNLFSREAESIIEAHDEKKPLFLVVNHLAPHTANEDEPLQAPREEIDKFPYIKDENRRIYAGMVSRLDESIGNITKALDKKQILNNTILIFYSDNGAPSIGMFSNTGSNWPMRGQKNTPWEGGVRVAGAIWSPLLQGRRKLFKQTMSVADWLPTLASAANIDLSPDLDLDGLDLWEELSLGGQVTVERDIVHMLDDIEGVTSYLSGNYKYINGTTLNGIANDVLTYRTPKEVDPRNAKYAINVIKSTSGEVLAKYDKTPLKVREINSIRASAQIKCGNPNRSTDCNPLVEECLYRIDRDPCERNNLARSARFAAVLNDMREAIEIYRSSAVQPGSLPGVPQADPSQHDCTWTWINEPSKLNDIRNCGYTGPPCQMA